MMRLEFAGYVPGRIGRLMALAAEDSPLIEIVDFEESDLPEDEEGVDY